MSEFSYSKNGLSVSQYGSDHVCAQLSTRYGRDQRTIVEVAHFPQASAGAENQCGEYALEIKVLGSAEPFSSTSVAAHLSREDIERLHRATGALLARSEGIGRGGEHSRVVCDPQDEKTKIADVSFKWDETPDEEKTCEDCSVVDPAEEQFDPEKVSS